MDEKTRKEIGKIAETAFKNRFGDIDVVAVNVRPDADKEDPTVWVTIVYDGEVEQLTGRGILGIEAEVCSKAQFDTASDAAFPVLSFVAKSEIGRRNPETV